VPCGSQGLTTPSPASHHVLQADHGLTPNGDVGASLWTSLIGAIQANTVNTGGYNYALADKASAQSLTIYHDGVVVLRSLANMGIAGSPTARRHLPRLHAS